MASHVIFVIINLNGFMLFFGGAVTLFNQPLIGEYFISSFFFLFLSNNAAIFVYEICSLFGVSSLVHRNEISQLKGSKHLCRS